MASEIDFLLKLLPIISTLILFATTRHAKSIKIIFRKFLLISGIGKEVRKDKEPDDSRRKQNQL